MARKSSGSKKAPVIGGRAKPGPDSAAKQNTVAEEKSPVDTPPGKSGAAAKPKRKMPARKKTIQTTKKRPVSAAEAAVKESASPATASGESRQPPAMTEQSPKQAPKQAPAPVAGKTVPANPAPLETGDARRHFEAPLDDPHVSQRPRAVAVVELEAALCVPEGKAGGRADDDVESLAHELADRCLSYLDVRLGQSARTNGDVEIVLADRLGESRVLFDGRRQIGVG